MGGVAPFAHQRRSKSPGALTVPDIDDWVFQFERAAALRLKEIFERDMNWTIPEKMIEQLKELRVAEEQRRKSEPR